MRDATFPKPASEVVATLAELFRHQSQREVVELLENAHAYFDQTEFANWNGGTYTWALRLQVPVHIFATIEPRLSAIEKEIAAKLAIFDREYSNDRLNEVTVSPITAGTSPIGQRMAPSEVEVRRVWSDGRFRLFLSHVSNHKVAAAALKDALWIRGIDSFVAHEDIEPSREWQGEIELALRSMHALAAMMTPDFHPSKWTDQEVGWALGRGVLVLPLRLGVDPYGLVQKIQGVSGTLTQPKRLAARIAQVLLSNPQSHGEMRRAVIRTLEHASTEETAMACCPIVVSIADLNDEEKARVWNACASNHNLAGAAGVCERIYSAIGRPPEQCQRALSEEDIPF